MSKGLIFDIEEFTIYDGPGIRTSVFFKGCPLRCEWCHNPEGLSFKQQIVKSPNGCQNCGTCTRECSSPGNCILCGRCTKVCPGNLIRFSGEYWEAEDLVKKLRGFKSFFDSSGGGLTFSGGEVLSQPEFLYDLLTGCRGINRAIETSGYAPKTTFEKILSECDLVMYDLKSINDDIHKRYTGVSNKIILENFRTLVKSGKEYIARVPLIPGVNDIPEHFEGIARLMCGEEGGEGPYSGNGRVEILPYNTMAGAKYTMMGMEYKPTFPADREPERPFEALDRAGIRWKVL